MSNSNQSIANPLTLSIPDPGRKPFRLIIDVAPIRQIENMPLLGDKTRLVDVGLERIDLSVTIQEIKEGNHE